MAWMWGALLAATMAAWLHQLTALTAGEDILYGHGVRGGKAMIAVLRWRLIAVPGRLTRHARHLTLRLPPGHGLLPEVLARGEGVARSVLVCVRGGDLVVGGLVMPGDVIAHPPIISAPPAPGDASPPACVERQHAGGGPTRPGPVTQKRDPR